MYLYLLLNTNIKTIKNMNTKTLNYTNLNNSRNVFNRTKTILSLLLVSILFFTSCKSDENEDEKQKPDGVALNQRFKDNRAAAVQTFTLNGSTGGTVTGEQGTQVTFSSNSVGLNGNPITGDFTVELIEIYGKGAMVLQDKSTKGKKMNGDEEALLSAGEFFINAKQNGTQLEVLTTITIQSKDVAPGDFESMQVFRADDDIDGDALWEETDEDGDGQNDNAQGGERGNPNGTYVLFSVFDMSSFGWSNLDRWSNYTGQLTDLFVDVPDGFNGDNTAVYLSYDGENGLARMDIYDSTAQLFTEHYGRIPVGKEVHFIMITEIAGQVNYTIQAATIVDGHTEVMANPQPISQADLTTLINNLP